MAALKCIPRKLSDIPNFGAKEDYPQVKAGQPIRLNFRRKDLFMACCDCGLIHRLRFNVRGEWLIIRGRRAGRLSRKPAAPVRTEKGER